MKQDNNLRFLRAKIQETNTAICTVYHDALIDASFIVHTDSSDDDGNIYFKLVGNLPPYFQNDTDPFGLRLFYFKKGLGYHLNVDTKAIIVRSEDNDATVTNPANKHEVFIKAKIMAAEYAEKKKRSVVNYSDTAKRGFFSNMSRKLSRVAASILWF